MDSAAAPHPLSPLAAPADGPPPGRTEWARRVIALRRARSWSRRELARELWVSWRTVEHWERGDREPRAATRRSLSHLEAGAVLTTAPEKS